MGIFLVLGTVIQALVGVANRISLASERFNVDRSRFNWIRFIHNYLGRSLILLAFAQVALGLEVLYPLDEVKFRGYECWAIYISLLSIWVILFLIAETYFRFMIANVGLKLNTAGERTHLTEKSPLIELENLTKGTLKKYSWQDIDNAVSKG